MGRPVITDEAELRRIILHVRSRVRNVDEFYRAIVRIAVIDLDDLRRLLYGEGYQDRRRRLSAGLKLR